MQTKTKKQITKKKKGKKELKLKFKMLFDVKKKFASFYFLF